MEVSTCWEPTAPRLARCVHVCDGDTIHVHMAWRTPTDSVARWLLVKCRLFGINSPEMHAQDDHVRQQAKECKKLMADLVLNKVVIVVFIADKHRDPFGRSLARILLPNADADIPASLLENPDSVLSEDVVKNTMDVNLHMLLHGPGTVSFHPS